MENALIQHIPRAATTDGAPWSPSHGVKLPSQGKTPEGRWLCKHHLPSLRGAAAPMAQCGGVICITPPHPRAWRIKPIQFVTKPSDKVSAFREILYFCDVKATIRISIPPLLLMLLITSILLSILPELTVYKPPPAACPL